MGTWGQPTLTSHCGLLQASTDLFAPFVIPAKGSLPEVFPVVKIGRQVPEEYLPCVSFLF